MSFCLVFITLVKTKIMSRKTKQVNNLKELRTNLNTRQEFSYRIALLLDDGSRYCCTLNYRIDILKYYAGNNRECVTVFELNLN